MTVSNLVTLVSYAGDGTTTSFPLTQDIYTNESVKAYLRDASGVETLQTLTTHYTLTGVPATAVAMVTAPAVGVTLVLVRDTVIDQDIGDYIATGAFPAETHEEVLDELTRMMQELNYKLRRIPAFKITTPALLDTELPDVVAEGIFRWNAAGTAIEYVASSVFIGPTGATGAAGAAGADGSDGSDGSDGAAGADGSTIPTTTKGDISTHDGADFARLPVGTNGQILQANSTESTGLEWVAVPTSVSVTTKGDLQTYDTGAQRLGVGTNGQVLQADSAEATGLKWVTQVATGATASNFTADDPTIGTGVDQVLRYTGSSPLTLTTLTLTSLPDNARLMFVGTSDTNTLTIPASIVGNQNGDKVLHAGQTAKFFNDATLGLLEI